MFLDRRADEGVPVAFSIPFRRVDMPLDLIILHACPLTSIFGHGSEINNGIFLHSLIPRALCWRLSVNGASAPAAARPRHRRLRPQPGGHRLRPTVSNPSKHVNGHSRSLQNQPRMNGPFTRNEKRFCDGGCRWGKRAFALEPLWNGPTGSPGRCSSGVVVVW
jgi:hypothetical protein